MQNIFDDTVEFGDEGICILIHAEIIVSDLKNNLPSPVPPWFLEDLTFLFHLTDRFDVVGGHSFRARVFWLHCHWHNHHCRVEIALNFLERVTFFDLPDAFHLSLYYIFELP